MPRKSIPDDIARAFAELGYSQSKLERIAGKLCDSDLRLYLEKIVEDRQRFGHWYPQIQAYAEEQRLICPLPDSSQLSVFDQGRLRILRQCVLKAEGCCPIDDYTATICTAPLWGLSLLKKEWPSKQPHPIYLTPEEWAAWVDGPYSSEAENVFTFWGWFVRYWWDVVDETFASSTSFLLDTPLDPDHPLTPLTVVEGLQWGSLAGGETTSIWSWDGVEEKFMRVVTTKDF
jgi:hypothetical protein